MPDAPETPWYADDLAPGTTRDLGTWTVTADEIVAFGRSWDPLPIHTDAAAAAASPFGGLIASGVHSMAVMQRLSIIGFYRHGAVIAGRGFKELRLPAPIRAGTVVRGTVTVEAVERHRPDRAVVHTRGTLQDASGTVLFEVLGEVVARCRPGT